MNECHIKVTINVSTRFHTYAARFIHSSKIQNIIEYYLVLTMLIKKQILIGLCFIYSIRSFIFNI